MSPLLSLIILLGVQRILGGTSRNTSCNLIALEFSFEEEIYHIKVQIALEFSFEEETYHIKVQLKFKNSLCVAT